MGSLAMAAAVLAFGAGLISCSGGGGDDDDGNGPNPIRLYFGINNDGDCKSIEFDIDVADAQSVIERNGSDVDCSLNAALQANGCQADFELINNNETVHVTISGCTIPSVSNVFLCDFVDADISELTDQTEATCTCKKAGCDTTPPVCISEDPDPGSCEDCDNHIDDDDNGFIDCDDENCEHSPLCRNGGETTTTTTSSSTVTVTTSSTTTTTLPAIQNCTLTYRMTTAVTVGSIEWDTDYSSAAGRMRGSGANVRCESLVTGALTAFNDNDQTKNLSAGFVKLTGAAGPVDLVECKFDATGPVASSDFDITVTQASDIDVDPIVPLPAIILKSLECITATTTTLDGGGTTTTLDGGGDTTTTTLDGGGGTTTTTLDGGGGTTTTTLDGGGPQGNVRFELTSSSAPVGALQFTVDYAGAAGEFEGTGAEVNCSGNIEGALFAPNDKDGERKLTLGIIAIEAFSAPIRVVNCVFIPTNQAEPPSPSDFVITINDATDAEGNDVAVTVETVIAP